MRKIFLSVIPAKATAYSGAPPKAVAGIHYLLLFCIFMFPSTASRAAALTPVQSITLTYDLNKTVLHVVADHPSANWDRDYVRMMTVSVNSQMVSTLNYYRQTAFEGFSDDVQLNAKAGDVITVELFCTQGSSKSQDLTVT